MSLSILPIIYFILVLIIPIGSLLATSNVENFWSLATEPVALSAYFVTFSMALIASLINGIFGFLLAWVLVRYDFPGKKTLDAAIDLPFALPTSVAGLTLATIYSPQGWIGQLVSYPKDQTSTSTFPTSKFIQVPFIESVASFRTEGEQSEGLLASLTPQAGDPVSACKATITGGGTKLASTYVSRTQGKHQKLALSTEGNPVFPNYLLFPSGYVVSEASTPIKDFCLPLEKDSNLNTNLFAEESSRTKLVSFTFGDGREKNSNLVSRFANFVRPHIQLVQTRTGVALAMIFVSFPFVVRNLQPVLQEMDTELEEIAWSLGANSWVTFRKIILPPLLPTWIAGITLSFSRAIGEYGSVVVMASNIPLKDLIASVLVFQKLEQYETLGATVIGTVVLLISLFLLLGVQILQNYFLQNQK